MFCTFRTQFLTLMSVGWMKSQKLSQQNLAVKTQGGEKRIIIISTISPTMPRKNMHLLIPLVCTERSFDRPPFLYKKIYFFKLLQNYPLSLRFF